MNQRWRLMRLLCLLPLARSGCFWPWQVLATERGGGGDLFAPTGASNGWPPHTAVARMTMGRFLEYVEVGAGPQPWTSMTAGRNAGSKPVDA